jgi:hypothetical protein
MEARVEVSLRDDMELTLNDNTATIDLKVQLNGKWSKNYRSDGHIGLHYNLHTREYEFSGTPKLEPPRVLWNTCKLLFNQDGRSFVLLITSWGTTS